MWGSRRGADYRCEGCGERRHAHASHIADYEKAEQLRDLLRFFFFLRKFSAHIDGVDDGNAAARPVVSGEAGGVACYVALPVELPVAQHGGCVHVACVSQRAQQAGQSARPS